MFFEQLGIPALDVNLALGSGKALSLAGNLYSDLALASIRLRPPPRHEASFLSAFCLDGSPSGPRAQQDHPFPATGVRSCGMMNVSACPSPGDTSRVVLSIAGLEIEAAGALLRPSQIQSYATNGTPLPQSLEHSRPVV